MLGSNLPGIYANVLPCRKRLHCSPPWLWPRPALPRGQMRRQTCPSINVMKTTTNCLPASAASVLPDSPVITIEGICDHPSRQLLRATAEDRRFGCRSGQKESGGSFAGSPGLHVKTIVTKAQFENAGGSA